LKTVATLRIPGFPNQMIKAKMLMKRKTKRKIKKIRKRKRI